MLEILFWVLCFFVIVILFRASGRAINEMKEYLSKNGYHKYTGSSMFLTYLGGIKNVSIKNVNVIVLEEGILFDCINRFPNYIMIPFEKIRDISIETERSLKEKASLGKILLFGVFAFGMKGKTSEVNREYISLFSKYTNTFLYYVIFIF